MKKSLDDHRCWFFCGIEPAAAGGSDMKKKNINNLFLKDE